MNDRAGDSSNRSLTRRGFLATMSAVGLCILGIACREDSPAQTFPTLGIASDDRVKAYFDELLTEINYRRDLWGSPLLNLASEHLNQQACDYLTELTPPLRALNTCLHGGQDSRLPAPGWDFVRRTGFRGEARGEVLGCPTSRPGDLPYWTPPRVAQGWMDSSKHNEALYLDRKANTAVLGVYEPSTDYRAFRSVVCLTYRV